MTQYRQVPTFDHSLQEGEITSSQWYRYWQTNDSGLPPSAETIVTAMGSPFTYSAKRAGFVLVNGGTVSAIAYSRSGTFYSTGQTSGSFSVSQNDQLRITYSVAPQIVFVPT